MTPILSAAVISAALGQFPPTPEQSRDRILNDTELRDVWIAADKLGGPFGALVKLLILTASAATRSRA